MIEVATTTPQMCQTDAPAQLDARGQAASVAPAISVALPAEEGGVTSIGVAANRFQASGKSTASALASNNATKRPINQEDRDETNSNHPLDGSPGGGSTTNSSSSWSLSRRNGELQKLSVVLPQKLDPKLASLATPTIVCSNDQGSVPMTSQLWGSLVQLNGGSDVGRFTGLPSCTPTSADCIVTNPFFWGVTPAHPFNGSGEMQAKHVVDLNGNSDMIDNRMSAAQNGTTSVGYESRRSLSTSSRETTISSVDSAHLHAGDQSHQSYNHNNSHHHHYRRNHQELSKLSLDQIQAAAQNQVTLLSPFLTIPMLSPEQEAWLRLTTQHPLAAAAEHHHQQQQMLNSYHNRQKQMCHQAVHPQHQHPQQQQPDFNVSHQNHHLHHHTHHQHPDQHQYTARNTQTTAPQDLTKQQQQQQQQQQHYQYHLNQSQAPNLSFNVNHGHQQPMRQPTQQSMGQQTISSQYLNPPLASHNRQVLNLNSPFAASYSSHQPSVMANNVQIRSNSTAPQTVNTPHQPFQHENEPTSLQVVPKPQQVVSEKVLPVLTVTSAAPTAQPPPIANQNHVQHRVVRSPITQANNSIELAQAPQSIADLPARGQGTLTNGATAVKTNGIIHRTTTTKQTPLDVHSSPGSNESSSSQSSTGASSISSDNSQNSSSLSGHSLLKDTSRPKSKSSSRSLVETRDSNGANSGTKKPKKKQKVASGSENTNDITQINTSGLITINGLPPQPTKKKSKGGRKKKLITHEEYVQRKNRSKERNRVAAKRCRQKRKQLLDELHDQKEELRRHNVTLQEENAILKRELETLKSQHSRCEVRLVD